MSEEERNSASGQAALARLRAHQEARRKAGHRTYHTHFGSRLCEVKDGVAEIKSILKGEYILRASSSLEEQLIEVQKQKKERALKLVVEEQKLKEALRARTSEEKKKERAEKQDKMREEKKKERAEKQDKMREEKKRKREELQDKMREEKTKGREEDKAKGKGTAKRARTDGQLDCAPATDTLACALATDTLTPESPHQVNGTSSSPTGSANSTLDDTQVNTIVQRMQ